MTQDAQNRSLAHSRQLQEVLVELLRAEPGDLGETLARISGVAGPALVVARTSIWLFNDLHTELRCLHLYDQQRNTTESGGVLAVAMFPNYFATLEETRVIAAEDARTHPATSEFTESYLDVLGITSMLDVPLRREGHAEGVLCFEHIGPRREWTLDEQNFAASLADLTSLVLETDRRRKAHERLKLLRQSDGRSCRCGP
ncbi:MAG: GAF domain-containing protein [Acidobacteriota bacterium]